MTLVAIAVAIGFCLAFLIARFTFMRPASPAKMARWQAESDARIAALKAEWKAGRARGLTIAECDAIVAEMSRGM